MGCIMMPYPMGYVTSVEAGHLPNRKWVRLLNARPDGEPAIPVYDGEGVDAVFKASVAIVARMLRVHENRDAQTAETLARQMLRAQLEKAPT